MTLGGCGLLHKETLDTMRVLVFGGALFLYFRSQVCILNATVRKRQTQCCLFTLETAQFQLLQVKVKAIPVQAWTGPEGSRRLSLPDFKKIGT